MPDRRSLLRGLAALPLAKAVSTPALATAIDAEDVRLVELADAIEALERACNAHIAARRGRRSTRAEEDDFGDLCSAFIPLEDEIAETSASTMVGVLAKARALQVKTCRDCIAPEFGISLADDVWRLFGGGPAHG